MSFVLKLKNALPEQRPRLLTDLYEKNLKYFEASHPLVLRQVEQAISPYEIDITDDFVDIVDTRSGTSVFGALSALQSASAEGRWSHQGWEELTSLQFNRYPYHFEHSKILANFTFSMKKAFPQFRERFARKKIHLPAVGPDKRFSNAVIFSGIFHGLHLDYFLSHTEVGLAAFYEADPGRFIVSCYFLDYEELDQRFNGLLLHVGSDLPNEFFSNFFIRTYVTSNVWLRVLSAYNDAENSRFVRRLYAFWQSQKSIWAPADQYLDAVRWTTENIKSKRKVMQQQPDLSDDVRIAIVASGPSLSEDLAWLKKNSHKLLVFAAHSAVRPLKAAGVIPDIQFCLDLYMDEPVYDALSLDPDIPFLADVRATPELLERFRDSYLVAGTAISYSVYFKLLLLHTMPTTGNLCTSFSCFLNPKEIYFFGLDMGFKTQTQSHAAGSCYDDIKGLQEKMAGENTFRVKANFSESEMLTNPYFNDAKRWIEELISLQTVTRFINCSDGAEIAGAKSQHSSDIDLPEYPDKENDLRQIFSAFRSVEMPGRCWEYFADSMEEVLADVRAQVTRVLLPERMTRLEFARALDLVLFQIMVTRAKQHKSDRRCKPYTDILRDVFVSWYKFCVYAENEDEFTFLYQTGKKLVIDILAQLRNPES